ncbi:hypothetical protein [Leptospira santarosai]|uniref:hypothetical protein n=1 Tax=Leptospira santarosai TaxID=28183 RepID=UPI00131A8CD4
MIYFPDRWDSILKISKAPKHTSAALRSLDDDGSLGRKRRTPNQTQTKPGIDFNLCRKRGGLFLDARLHWLKTESPEEGIKRAEKNLLTTFK